MRNAEKKWAIEQALHVWIQVLSKYHQGFDEELFETRIARLAKNILKAKKKLSNEK